MAAVNPLVTTAAHPSLFIVMLRLLSWLTGRPWAGGLSERHIPKAVGGVDFVLVVHVVAGHVRARGIGAIRHERIGVGAVLKPIRPCCYLELVSQSVLSRLRHPLGQSHL